MEFQKISKNIIKIHKISMLMGDLGSAFYRGDLLMASWGSAFYRGDLLMASWGPAFYRGEVCNGFGCDFFENIFLHGLFFDVGVFVGVFGCGHMVLRCFTLCVQRCFC